MDPASDTAADPDFAAQVVADLYRYRPRGMVMMASLATFAGVLGAHRFYVGKPFTGLAMMLSGGGALFWWIRDLFHLRPMMEAYNQEEARREQDQLPPQGLGFLPPKDQLKLTEPPAWVHRRSSRGRTIGTAILLALIGLSLGTVSGATGIYEPAIILALFIVISLTAARWHSLARVPILASLTRWVHRLRLYYHTVDPGNIWLLAIRPLLGILLAFWQPKVRAEVRLYLQFGVALSLVFAIQDAIEFVGRSGFWVGFGLLAAEFAQTLVYTFAFVAPAGALLTTQLLVAKKDYVVWGLSAINLGMIYLGMWIVGAA